jgi:hypothetical protein
LGTDIIPYQPVDCFRSVVCLRPKSKPDSHKTHRHSSGTTILRTDSMRRFALVISIPVCVSLFLLSGVVNEKIKGQFEDENAKFRPVPPVPDTGC